MCKSVPQIEAALTRTSTSVGPIAGTATVSICRPRVGCIFRNAFIVVVILSALDKSSRRTPQFDASTRWHRLQFTLRFKAPLSLLNLSRSLSSVSCPFPPSSPTADLSCSTRKPPQATSSLPAASHPPRFSALRYARLLPSLRAVVPDPEASLPAGMPASRVLSRARRRRVARWNQTPESSMDSRTPRTPPRSSSPVSAPLLLLPPAFPPSSRMRRSTTARLSLQSSASCPPQVRRSFYAAFVTCSTRNCFFSFYRFRPFKALLISPLQEFQFSRAPSNTQPPIPAAPARTPLTPHRESLARSACHRQDSKLHTHTLRHRPTIPRNSAASGLPLPPFSHDPRNSHTQTPLAGL